MRSPDDAGLHVAPFTTGARPHGQAAWSNPRAAMPPGRDPRRRHRLRSLLLLLLIGMVIISTVIVAANLYRGDSTLVARIGDQQTAQIDLQQSVAISPYLLGSNVFPRTGTISKDRQGSGFMSYDQRVVQGLRSAGVKLLRFPGGNWGEEHTPSQAQLNDFSDLLNQVGAEGIMQVPLSDPEDAIAVPLQTRASRAALLVDYMNNSKSIQRLGVKAPFHPIKYWTIGNEPDLLINPDTQRKYTVAEYTRAFIAYSLAMHQKDPTIKVFGPEISQYPGPQGPKDATGRLWMEGFLSAIGGYERTHALSFHLLDGVSLHRYPFNNAQQAGGKLLENPAEWERTLPQLRQFIRQQFGADLPIAITEINTNPGKSVPSPELAAVWWADTLGELMSNQVEYVTFFSTEGVDTPYPLFLRQDLKETALLRTMQLFAHLQRDFVPVQMGQGPVGLYATQDQGHNTVSILFINKTSQPQRVSVRADSLLPFSAWRSATLNIPAYGLVVLNLQRGGSDSALSFPNSNSTQQSAPDIQRLVCDSNAASTLAC